MQETTYFDFSEALKLMKIGNYVRRASWNDLSIKVFAQYPDEGSANTKPYLVMKKGEDRFPLDLSCESIFGEDWYVCQE